MKGNVGKILKYTVSILLAAALLFFSFRGVDWKFFFSQIGNCAWGMVLLSMLCGAVAFVFRGLRWRHLLLPLDPSTRIMPPVDGINISNVANMVIPYSGEFVRCGVITAHSKKDAQTGRPLASYDKVLGTAALERALDVFSIIVLLGVLLVFRWQKFSGFLFDYIWRPMVNSLGDATWFILVLVVLAAAGCTILIRSYRDSSRLCAKICTFCSSLLQGFSACLRMKHNGLFLLYTALIWIMYWLQMVLILDAMPSIEGLDITDALFLMLIGSFASVIPVPGGFGAYHYIVSLSLFCLYGYPKETLGIVFASLAHESQALAMILTGAWSYAHNILSLNRKARKSQPSV